MVQLRLSLGVVMFRVRGAQQFSACALFHSASSLPPPCWQSVQTRHQMPDCTTLGNVATAFLRSPLLWDLSWYLDLVAGRAWFLEFSCWLQLVHYHTGVHVYVLVTFPLIIHLHLPDLHFPSSPHICVRWNLCNKSLISIILIMALFP